MSSLSNNGSSNSIWSPAIIDGSSIASSTACLDSRTWSQAAAVAAATSSSNCYQNYAGYYSNMDYLGPSVQQQLVSKIIYFASGTEMKIVICFLFAA